MNAPSPVELAMAQIELVTADLRWRHSMYTELFDGEVTYSTDEYLAVIESWQAVQLRARDARHAAAVERLSRQAVGE